MIFECSLLLPLQESCSRLMWGDSLSFFFPSVCVFPQRPGGLWLTTEPRMSHPQPTLSHGQRHWRFNPPTRTHKQHTDAHTHTQGNSKAIHLCVWKQQETKTMASSSSPQQHLLMFLWMQPLIIVPLVLNQIAAPYSQSTHFKVADSHSNFIEGFSISITESHTCAITSSLMLFFW